jgi:hypothetical protein
LEQLPGNAERKGNALKRLRKVDAHWRTFLSAEFEIFTIAVSALLADYGYNLKEVYACVDNSYIELSIERDGFPIYVEAKALQESKEGVLLNQAAELLPILLGQARKDLSLRKVSLHFSFRWFPTEIELEKLSQDVANILKDCSVPSTHDLQIAYLRVNDGSGIQAALPPFDYRAAKRRVRRMLEDARRQLGTDGVAVVWIKLHWGEDPRSQVDEVVSLFEGGNLPTVAAVVVCGYHYWKCDESSLIINPRCEADKSIRASLCDTLRKVLLTPWYERYRWRS